MSYSIDIDPRAQATIAALPAAALPALAEPVLGGEPVERRAHALRELGEHACLLVVGRRVGRLGREVGQRGPPGLLALDPPVLVDDRVAGDPVHPPHEVLVVLDPVHVAVDAQHDLGEDVVGPVRVGYPPVYEAAPLRPELVPDLLGGRRIRAGRTPG